MKNHELAAAGITDPELVQAFRACDTQLVGHNPAAYPDTRCLLPPAKRPHYDALLAFCRYADDLIDDPERSVGERADRFDRFRDHVTAVFDGLDGSVDDGDPTVGSIATAFAHTTHTWGITGESVQYFLRTIRDDLEVTGYPTYRHLERYMRGVSGEPGTWINALVEPRSPEAERMAVALSHAVYLLDFITDIAEDLRLGRVYLPQEDLERVGLSRDELESAVSGSTMTAPVRQLVRYQVSWAEQLLNESEEWWRLVHPSSRWFIRRYHVLSRASLRWLVRRDYDALRPESRVRAAWGHGTTLGGLGLTFLRATAERPSKVSSSAASRTPDRT